MSPMKPVTRAVATRASRRQVRSFGPSSADAATASPTGTMAAREATGSIVAMTTSATDAAAMAPETSSHTSSTSEMSCTSSRNRLTASPDDPGSRPATGPGPVASDESMLTRGTVIQPTHAPCHCTAAETSSDQRPTSTPTSMTIMSTGMPGSGSTRSSRTTLRMRPTRSGLMWKPTHWSHATA